MTAEIYIFLFLAQTESFLRGHRTWNYEAYGILLFLRSEARYFVCNSLSNFSKTQSDTV